MQNDLFSQIEKSVFIISYGRTGSTLIQNLINKLPGYLVRGENGNLLAPLVRAWRDLRYSQLAKNMRAASIDWHDGRPSPPRQPWFGYETIDSDQLGRGLAEVFMRDVLRPNADTRVLGFKEIRWHYEPDIFPFMLEFLQRYMPGEVRIIFNTRNHEEVVVSGQWKDMKQEDAFRELEEADTLFAEWQKGHPGDFLTLHYNDFASDPDAWCPLFDFLGEPYNLDLVQAVLGEKLLHGIIPPEDLPKW